jgi:hypothetical protein
MVLQQSLSVQLELSDFQSLDPPFPGELIDSISSNAGQEFMPSIIGRTSGFSELNNQNQTLDDGLYDDLYVLCQIVINLIVEQRLTMPAGVHSRTRHRQI